MATKLSVCIVAYKNYEDVKKAVSTMERYTSVELEKKIYIVDNAAAEMPKNLVEEFKLF